jgi:Ca2+-binding RTX toxin-like protein
MPSGEAMRIRAAVLAAGFALSATGVLMAPAEATDVLCFGEPVTIMGTDGDDRLLGSPDVRDVIFGGAGDDLISSSGDYFIRLEADLMCGGPGNDTLGGGMGDDMLRGGTGDDEVAGWHGNDIMRGGPGADRIGTGAYADASRTDADMLYGGPGDDSIGVDWGPDKAYGQGGDDYLGDSECSNAVLNGGRGDDSFGSYFDGYDGGSLCLDLDRIIGGNGTDTATVNAEDSLTAVEDIKRVVEVPTTMTATSPVESVVRAGGSVAIDGVLEIPGATGTRQLLLIFDPDDKSRRGNFLYADSKPAVDGVFPFSQLSQVNESGTWTVYARYGGRGDGGPGDWDNYEISSNVSYHVTAKSSVQGWPKQNATKDAGTKVSKTVTVAPAYQRSVILQRKNCPGCHWRNALGVVAPKGPSADLTLHWKVPRGVTRWRIQLPESVAGTRTVTDSWRIKGR